MTTSNYTKIIQFQEVPVEEKYRICTDKFCIYIGISFTLVLLILTAALFNNDHYIKTSFPSDSDGRVCGYDLLNTPYLYFTSFPDIKNRVCVSTCPSKDDKALKCIPTKGIGCLFNNNTNFSVSYYENELQSTEIGYFCVPKDEGLKEKLFEDIDISVKYTFFNQINSIFISALIAVGLSILFLIAVQFFSNFMNNFVIIAGLAMIILMVIFTVLQKNINMTILIIFSIVMVALFVFIMLGALKSRQCFDLHGIFLKYATKVISNRPSILIYILIFTGIFVLFLMLVALELKSLWSFSSIYYEPESVYYKFSSGSTTFFSLLVGVQVVWGCSFIQLAFNFCISGNAIQWYYQPENNQQSKNKNNRSEEEGEGYSEPGIFTPVKYLFKYHFGSVIGGAFMEAFLFVFDYIFDIARSDCCDCGSENKCVSYIDSCLDLTRTDAMAFIVLTGNPYCNSSRYCELLCYKAPASRYSQSNGRSYRICSHIFIGGIVAIINIYLQGQKISIFIIMIVFLLSSVISTFFINVHEDANEAIQIFFLFEYSFAKDSQADKNGPNFNEDKVMRIHQNIRRTQLADEVYNQAQKIMKYKKQERDQKEEKRIEKINNQ